MYCPYVNCCFCCTVWSTLVRISLTKALVLWWCDNKSDLIWFDLKALQVIMPNIIHIFIRPPKNPLECRKSHLLNPTLPGGGPSAMCFTECNQYCPSPVGCPYQRLWAFPQTTRMQGTTSNQFQFSDIWATNLWGCMCGIIWITPDKIALQGFVKSWQVCYCNIIFLDKTIWRVR